MQITHHKFTTGGIRALSSWEALSPWGEQSLDGDSLSIVGLTGHAREQPASEHLESARAIGTRGSQQRGRSRVGQEGAVHPYAMLSEDVSLGGRLRKLFDTLQACRVEFSMQQNPTTSASQTHLVEVKRNLWPAAHYHVVWVEPLHGI